MMKKSINIGFIGFGEVARSISEGLKGKKDIHLFAYHYKGLNVSPDIQEMANLLNVQLMATPLDLAKNSDVILNVTRSNAAEQSAYEILPYLTNDHIYIDLNSTSPNLMREISKKFAEKGKCFIDGVLLEPLPIKKHEAAIILSGINSEKAAFKLNLIGMNIEVLDNQAGTASSFKLVKSIFMKGLSALLIETFVAAKLSGGAYEKIMESIDHSLSTSFDKLLNRFLTGTVLHAPRRIIEMEDAHSFVSELGMEPVMTNSTIELLKKISASNNNYQSDSLGNLEESLYHYYKSLFIKSDSSE
jgi:3-hydroxyisobutyrate dehydrogenase-like beta-hydroxyacid dehydrogenase